MKERGGVIVNTSSVVGYIGVLGYTDYAASKFGILGLSEAMRSEFKRYNISVSVLCPPDTRTAGFEVENQTKPEETKAISESGGILESDQVAKGLEFIFSKGMINPEHTGFFLECCVAARHNTRIRETIAELFHRFRRAIMDHLNGMAEFSCLEDRQKKLCASMIVALHEGIELQWFADPGAICLEDALKTTRALILFFIENPRCIK